MRYGLWRALTAAGIVAVVLLCSKELQACSMPEARTTIVVRTYTRPESAVDIQTARQTASAILSRARIRAEWLECGLPADAAGTALDACAEPLRWNELVVRIVSAGAVKSHPAADTLGFALVDAESGGGSLATVYADRVNALAHGAGADVAVLLGRTIAHELGHLLLGTNRHAPHGLMRASWAGADLRRNRATQWLFDGSEAEAMRRGIAGRFRPHAGEDLLAERRESHGQTLN
jgi:hypothetical protein